MPQPSRAKDATEEAVEITQGGMGAGSTWSGARPGSLVLDDLAALVGTLFRRRDHGQLLDGGPGDPKRDEQNQDQHGIRDEVVSTFVPGRGWIQESEKDAEMGEEVYRVGREKQASTLSPRPRELDACREQGHDEGEENGAGRGTWG
jgi:hypothetical protein